MLSASPTVCSEMAFLQVPVAKLGHERLVVAWSLMLLMLRSCFDADTDRRQTRLLAFAMNFLQPSNDVLLSEEAQLARVHLSERLYAESGASWMVPMTPDVLVSSLAPSLQGCFSSSKDGHLMTGLDESVQTFLAHFAETALSPRPVFVDIGSNTACASLLILACNPALHVHAFDPVPSNCEAAIQSVMLNNRTDRAFFSCVGLHNQALDKVDLKIPAPYSGHGQGMSTFCSDHDVLTQDEISVGACHRTRCSHFSHRRLGPVTHADDLVTGR